MGKVSKLY